jgi:two-component system, LytTR family, sensor kinase
MTYLFLLGLAHALAYRRESEARALDSAHLETRLIEAQLQALQRQLHPHFLFNTLNTISGLMRTDVNGADRMMDRLGDLLRITLHSSGVQEVPLHEELEMLQTYLDIEQTRFGKRLSVTIQIDPETLSAQVPNLLLQPLVEPHHDRVDARRSAAAAAGSRQRRRPAGRSADAAQSGRRTGEHPGAPQASLSWQSRFRVLERRRRVLRDGDDSARRGRPWQ